MGIPMHGYNGLIYVGGQEITGANQWSISVTADTVDVSQFGEAWKRNVGGQKAASGSVSGWQHEDEKILADALGTETTLHIYPNRNSLTDYWYGVVYWNGFDTDGSTTSAVPANAKWVLGNNADGFRAFGFDGGGGS